jgi:hypothetical protein
MIPTRVWPQKKMGRTPKGHRHHHALFLFLFRARGHLYFMYADKLVTPNKPIFAGTPRMAKEFFCGLQNLCIPSVDLQLGELLARFWLDLFTRQHIKFGNPL